MSDSEMEDSPTSPSRPRGPNQASATEPTSFNHGTLSIRPHISSLQAPSTQDNSQDLTQSTTNNNVSSFDLRTSPFKAHATEIEQMVAKGTFEQLGNGAKSAEDIQYYHQFKHYPARPIDRVEIDVIFTVTPKGGHTFTSWYPLTFPASKCDTFSNLFTLTKDHWPLAFQQVGKPFPAHGVLRKNLTILVKETHGDARGSWRQAYNPERYKEWYRDHVIHGRVDRLLMQLIHVELADN